MSTRPFRALVAKDLRLFLTDRRAVILAIVVPLVLASFMAFVFGGMSGSESRGTIEVRVVDGDQSAISKQIVADLASDELLAVAFGGEAEVREAVRGGHAAVAVFIPAHFGEQAAQSFFRPGARPTVTLLTDPTHSAEAGMVRGLLTQHVMENISRAAFSGVAGVSGVREALASVDQASDLSDEDRAPLRTMLESVAAWFEHVEAAPGMARTGDAGVPGLRTPFETREETVATGPEANRLAGVVHAFAGMIVQFVLFGSIEMAIGILNERQKGLWRRLRTAPLGRLTLLAARVASGTLISLLTIAVVFGLGMALFGIRIEGSPLGLLLVAVAYSLTASTLGLLIAALGKTPQAARGVSILVVLLMVMLGGAWMPSFLFPQWLQQATFAIPTRWAVAGFEAMTWRGGGLLEGLQCTGALLGFALVFAALALNRFRWEAE